MKKFFAKILIITLIFSNFLQINGVFSLEANLGKAQFSATGDQNVASRRLDILQNFFDSKIFNNFNFQNLKITIDSLQKEPRAQIKWREIRISSSVLDDSEFFKLFSHELGHFFDLYILRPTKNYADPSLDFYKISWKTTTTKHSDSSLKDFVSGYAATNKYEDFAESFVWYVFHNDNFYEKAMKNDVLRQKYLFFADYIFTKWEFQATDFSLKQEPDYLWDTTKITINLQNFLQFLKKSIY